jgi:hypothetical protein
MKIGTGLLGGLVALLSGARGLLRSSEAPRP